MSAVAELLAGKAHAHWRGVPSTVSTMFRPTVGGPILWLAVGLLTVAGLLAAALLVHRTGGTQYAWPYLILIPVILCAAIFKLAGGLIAALGAGILLGPWMPLNVDAGVMQTTENWLIRLAMYLAIGGFAGLLAMALDRAHRRSLSDARTDPASKLVSPVTAGRIATGAAPEASLPYRPTHAVVVDFGGHGAVVLALGIDIGNEVIRRLAGALLDLVGEEVLLTRIHGACFGVLLAGEDDEIARFPERLLSGLPGVVRVGDDVPVTLLPRFGVARLEHSDLDSGQPFRKALVAMRAAAEGGRRTMRYSPSLDVDTRENLNLLHDLRRDLENGGCEVHFQPKLDLRSNRILSAEALFRWTCPHRGPVPPGRVIPVIENTLLIDTLTRFVIEEAASELTRIRRIEGDFAMAMNVSMRNLEDETLIDDLLALFQRHDLPPGALELEVTETALMQNPQLVQRSLTTLRKGGFKLSIDDFGTGYSSLGYLKSLPVDTVKLDQAFVSDLPGNNSSREIATATVAMCKRLGYNVIAEGVETADAVAYLRNVEFDGAQGFHLAKPMPADAFRDWMRRQ